MKAVTCMDGITNRFYFCSNPTCVLHVRPGDPGVVGDGNWAEQKLTGIIVGRIIVDGVWLCDGCARQLIAGIVKLDIVPPPPRPKPADPPIQQALFTDP